MDYIDIINRITSNKKNITEKSNYFQTVSKDFENEIYILSKKDLLPLINLMGIIPEQFGYDSQEEKIFSKLTEIVLAKCFIELGLEAQTISTRSNEADIVATSKFHNYTLVSDAKAFRLTRTAKNQKDFKVESLNTWRKDKDFAVLCCPYYHYPKKASQIYAQALNNNVCLISWEHLSFLIKNNITESQTVNLKSLWDIKESFQNEYCSLKSPKTCFLDEYNAFFCKTLGLTLDELSIVFNDAKNQMISVGKIGKGYWQEEINKIKEYSKETAVKELISALKLYQKIKDIDTLLKKLEKC